MNTKRKLQRGKLAVLFGIILGFIVLLIIFTSLGKDTSSIDIAFCVAIVTSIATVFIASSSTPDATKPSSRCK